MTTMRGNPLARKYGAHYEATQEDPTRCAAGVWKGARGMIKGQCGRARGHGPDGILCAQHAKAGNADVPEAGSYGRWELERLERERAPLAARLASVDEQITRIRSALATLPKGGPDGTRE